MLKQMVLPPAPDHHQRSEIYVCLLQVFASLNLDTTAVLACRAVKKIMVVLTREFLFTNVIIPLLLFKLVVSAPIL